MSESNAATTVAAINEQRLSTWSQQHHPAAAAACARIGESVKAEAAELTTWIQARNLDLTINTDIGPRQRHTVTATSSSADAALRAADALAELGFERWGTWTGGAAESFRRTANELTIARTGSVSFVIQIRWGETTRAGLLNRLLRPSTGDWAMVDLPTQLWWGYSFVRPVRQLLERIGKRDRHESGLGPFLLTPRSLFTPLFELASLRPDDVLLDIGCGDGQLVEAAAAHAHCRAIGIEHDASLVERGKQRVAGSEATDRIELRHGDARDADLSDVTVAFMFLPMPVVGRIVESTLAQLPAGARLIVHEQTALPASIPIPPGSSTPVIADDAVTVAHLWHA